jgi:hypothetical protein
MMYRWRVLQVVNVAVANVREEVRISQQLEHEGRIGAPHVAQPQVGGFADGHRARMLVLGP